MYSIHVQLNNRDSAFYYLAKARQVNDTLTTNFLNNVLKFEDAATREKKRVDELELEKIEISNRNRYYVLASGILAFMIITGILIRNNRHRKKANDLLKQEKDKVENALGELKSTQSQLILSEKMASLGKLTSGIAHEIQNPLNFVNNFSDVNKELLEELKENAEKGNLDEIKTIADNVIANEEKIILHGSRADAIVKNMLLHSQSGAGAKEPTNINVLAEESLRLSFNGIRVKDKSFNAKFDTKFDGSLPKINIVPQDIGRVILNLTNNAFYAVNEKAKQNITGYDPTVTVSTKKTNGKIEISVKDNGNGFPDAIKEKIFQPFFTTKPTGSGTGLGLSLSYDIIKAHGGEIKVETKEGEGTKFILNLPLL
jgi:two-component system NtrC family sensor kinase